MRGSGYCLEAIYLLTATARRHHHHHARNDYNRLQPSRRHRLADYRLRSISWRRLFRNGSQPSQRTAFQQNQMYRWRRPRSAESPPRYLRWIRESQESRSLIIWSQEVAAASIGASMTRLINAGMVS